MNSHQYEDSSPRRSVEPALHTSGSDPTADLADWQPAFARRVGRFSGSEIRELLKLLERGNVTSFAGGIPDPELLPHQAVREACDRTLSDPATRAEALQYSVSEGYGPLREWIAADMRRRGVRCDPENVVIVNGSQQALDFTAKLFLNPGDAVLIQEPTFLGALQAFDSYEATYRPLSITSDASVTPFGESAPIRLAYVMPDFRNPTGDTASLDERETMLRSIAVHRVPLLEDNAYERLRYDGTALPSLMCLGLDGRPVDRGRYLYTSTFSESVAPGLRVAFIVAPRGVAEKLVLIKQGSDIQVATLNQMIVFRVLSDPTFAATIAAMCAVCRQRRDAMLAALGRHFPRSARWTIPDGGMFIWVTLPAGIDAHALLTRAVGSIGVAFVPGRAFFPDRSSGANTLRLSFSLLPPDRIERGIAELGALVRRAEAEVHVLAAG